MFVIIDKDSTTLYNNNKMFVPRESTGVTPYTFAARHFRTRESAQQYIEKLNKRNLKAYGHTTNYEIMEDK